MLNSIRIQSWGGSNHSSHSHSHSHSYSNSNSNSTSNTGKPLLFLPSRLSFRKPSRSPSSSPSSSPLPSPSSSPTSNNSNNKTKTSRKIRRIHRRAMDTYHQMLKSLRENTNKSSVHHLELKAGTIPANYDPFDLIQAIRMNETVCSVEIRKEFLLELTIEQGRNLFEAIGDLPRCNVLFCDFPNPRDGFPLQLHALTCVLTGSSPLQTISLRNLVLSRHENEISEALQRHAYLREFQVKDLVLVDRKITLDPLLHALARIPTLEVVEIRMKRQQSNALTLGPLRDICQSTSIQVLKLWQVKLTEELTVLMADALQGNAKLLSLTLFGCNLTRTGYVALAHMLRVNATLQELQLYDEGMDDTCCMAIASGLERNSTLEALTMQPLTATAAVYPY